MGTENALVAKGGAYGKSQKHLFCKGLGVAGIQNVEKCFVFCGFGVVTHVAESMLRI